MLDFGKSVSFRSVFLATAICLVICLCACARPHARGSHAPALSPAEQQMLDASANGEFAAWQNEVFRLTNQARARSGLPALRSAPVIKVVANRRAIEVARRYSHTRPNGRSWESILAEHRVAWSACAENIAMGQESPAEVVNSWMNSPGHRANILNKNLRHIGIGISRNGQGLLCWTQNFVTFR